MALPPAVTSLTCGTAMAIDLIVIGAVLLLAIVVVTMCVRIGNRERKADVLMDRMLGDKPALIVPEEKEKTEHVQ